MKRQILVALFVLFSSITDAHAQLDLVKVIPRFAAFNRPTEITLTGAFDFAEGDQIEVRLATTPSPSPDSDIQLFSVSASPTAITGITPRVGHVDMYIYVRNGDTVSNTLPFFMVSHHDSLFPEFMAGDLLAAFNTLDSDRNGTLNIHEVGLEIDGITPEEFALLDTNANGELTREELRAQAYYDYDDGPTPLSSLIFALFAGGVLVLLSRVLEWLGQLR